MKTRRFIFVTILAIMLCTIILGAFAACQPRNDEPQEETVDFSGMTLENVQGNRVRLSEVMIPQERYEDYGIAPIAESAKQLTATLLPAGATDKEIDWSVSWKNASSEWANGKDVSQYVTVQPTSDGALTANVSCLKPFGEQVIIKVVARDNPEITATCTADYVERITGFTFNIGELIESNNTFSYETEVSEHTVKSEITVTIGTEIKLTEEFQTNFYKMCGSDGSQGVFIVNALLSKAGDNKLSILSDGQWGYYDEDDYGAFSTNNLCGRFVHFDKSRFSNVDNDHTIAMGWFVRTAQQTSAPHAKFSVSYKAEYGGTVYSQGTKEIEVKFDVQSLRVPVSSLALGEGLYF